MLPLDRIPGHPVHLDPAAIEAAFTDVWRATAGDAYDAATVRLRVLNFVAVAAGAAAADERFDALMDVLPQRYPCRAVLALPDPAVAAVQASIAARCWRAPDARRQVCSEEVTLRAAPEQGRALASAVLALLLPELPVDVWCMDAADLRGEALAGVLPAADRVFIDSARAGRPDAAYRHALAVPDDAGAAVRDLAWQRLAAWRTLIAQIFDRADAVAALASLRSVEISGGEREPSSEALLLAGWFVSRLRLQPADVDARVGGFGATLYDGSRGLRLAVTADAGGVPLASVRLTTDAAAFLVHLHAESGHMHVREEWPDREHRRTVAMRPVDDAAVIMDALDDRDDPAVEAEAMRAIVELAG